MFWIIHILSGFAIATLISNIYIMIVIALLSHFILDSIPHWDGFFDSNHFLKTGKAKITKKVFLFRSIDGIIAILILFTLLITKEYYLFLAGFITLIPDIIKIGYFTKFKNNNLFRSYLHFHTKIQKNIKPFLGLLTQLIIAFICIYIIF